MISARVECDFPTCRRHFEVGGGELSQMAAVATDRDRAAVLVPEPIVMPEGWAVGERHGVVVVLCSDHAPRSG